MTREQHMKRAGLDGWSWDGVHASDGSVAFTSQPGGMLTNEAITNQVEHV